MLSFRSIGVLFSLAGVVLAVVVAFGAGRVARSDEIVTLVENVADDSIDVTGSIGGAAFARALPLSDEERGQIFDDIMSIRGVPEASLPWTATAMPAGIALQDLPASVTSDVPMVQGYKFVKLADRIVLVSPLDRSVVAVMPRYKLILD
jgi:hypothetical protein